MSEGVNTLSHIWLNINSSLWRCRQIEIRADDRYALVLPWTLCWMGMMKNPRLDQLSSVHWRFKWRCSARWSAGRHSTWNSRVSFHLTVTRLKVLKASRVVVRVFGWTEVPSSSPSQMVWAWKLLWELLFALLTNSAYWALLFAVLHCFNNLLLIQSQLPFGTEKWTAWSAPNVVLFFRKHFLKAFPSLNDRHRCNCFAPDSSEKQKKSKQLSSIRSRWIL